MHLDDAVLSCASVITKGSLVVTVFAAGPSGPEPLLRWDVGSGCFSPGDDIFALRAAEDDEALAHFEAHGQRLTFWDVQYREARSAGPVLMPRIRRQLRAWIPRGDSELSASIASELEATIGATGLDAWFVPLGIYHPDHVIVGGILPALMRRNPAIRWYVYEELPYALEQRHLRWRAHRRLESAGFVLEPIPVRADTELKRAAVSCYRSQLGPLGARVETALGAPERVYRALARQG